MNKKIFFIISLCIALFLAGCQSEDKEMKAELVPTPAVVEDLDTLPEEVAEEEMIPEETEESDKEELNEETIKVVARRIPPIKLDGPVSFDGCGKLDDYKGYDWYDDLDSQLKKVTLDDIGAISAKVLNELCFSKKGNLAVMIFSGDYCVKGGIFRFDSKNRILEQATLLNEAGKCMASFFEFGKRDGNVIPVTANWGDAGCKSTIYYDYDYVANTIKLTKSCGGCYEAGDSEDDFEEECKEY